MKHHQQYTPPLLKPKEIVQILKTLDIQLDAKNLDDAKNLQTAYEGFLEWLMNVQLEDFDVGNNERAMEDLEFPSLYDDAARKVALIQSVAKLFEAVCIPEHNYQLDHMNPTTKRVVFNLSAIINFARFREEHLGEYEELREKSDQLIRRKQTLLVENEELQRELEILKQQRKEAEPQIKVLSAETDELAAEVSAMNKTQADVTSRTRELKRSIEEVKATLKSDGEMLNNLKSQVRRLKGQIIESPEKTRKYIEELGREVEKEKEEIANLERKHRDLLARLDTLQKVERDVSKTIEAMGACVEQREKSKTYRKEIQETQVKIDDMKKKQYELDVELGHLKSQIELATKKSASLTDQYFHKKQSAEESRREAQAFRALQMKEGNTSRQKVQKNEEAVRKWEQKVTERRCNHNAEVEKIKIKYRDLENSVMEYHNRLFDAMQSPA
eukprot:CAMPEP_0119137916 /NCGR_PEP_ID=MMETSP1310-20130426/24633_1 /TAXON_ID=464262 /ORGANISM="Genus nov. species nov., Strain RCC2339" /LENGTH=442 /DNA_ID=CAMNT_0007129057 /DNA_START=36 /DNA_END=1361 /DNA_ORIENTATION=+